MIIEQYDFPHTLQQLPRQDIPQRLFCSGPPKLLNQPCIAIVGSRKCTELGKRTAGNIAKYFAREGYTIVSGMAPGIDCAAHQGALAVTGKTIAVLGSSLNPKDFRTPQAQWEAMATSIITAGGCLLTEYESGPANRERYNARNRIIVGLSLITIAIQCERRSGTLNSIHTAVRYGREVWVPRPIKDDPGGQQAYQGILDLIDAIEGRDRIPSLKVINSKDDYPGMEQHLQNILDANK